MFKNLRIKHALFAGYVALVFSFISCVNPAEPTRDKNWRQISELPSARTGFQSVVLPNSDILVMGGHDINGKANDIWRSSDGGSSWLEITSSAPWRARSSFQAVVLKNNDILVMGGFNDDRLNDIWSSSDEGRSWRQIPASNHWSPIYNFQSVVLANNDILVMGGRYGDLSSAIFLSKDGGTNWNQIPAADHWSPRQNFQAVVLANNDILVMGGRDSVGANNEVWLSKDGGTNWSVVNDIAPWPARSSFQSVVLNNGEILIMSGFAFNTISTVISPGNTLVKVYQTFFDDIWLSSDSGRNWRQFTDAAPWASRVSFQSVILPDNDVLVMGGEAYNNSENSTRINSEVWRRNF